LEIPDHSHIDKATFTRQSSFLRLHVPSNFKCSFKLVDDFPKCFNLFTYERLIEMFLG